LAATRASGRPQPAGQRTANIGPDTAAVLDLEYRMQHADQHWEWLEQIFQPAEASTHPVVQVFSQVITPRKLAETAMRRRELEFRTLVENSSDIIARTIWSCAASSSTAVSAAIRRMIRDEHIGKTVHEKGWPDNVVAQFEQECRRLIDSGEPRCFEMELLSLNRRYIFETRLFPEFDSNGKLTSICRWIAKSPTAVRPTAC
jgi:PAS domain-containing protein